MKLVVTYSVCSVAAMINICGGIIYSAPQVGTSFLGVCVSFGVRVRGWLSSSILFAYRGERAILDVNAAELGSQLSNHLKEIKCLN
jgi:hypothetical protein